MKKIMIVPWVVKNSPKCWGVRNPPPRALAWWARMKNASTIPRASITSASATYMMPIFLWSTLVSQSDQNGRHHRRRVRNQATARAPKTTNPAAPVAMAPFSTRFELSGCLMISQNGSASHQSRPNAASRKSAKVIADPRFAR